VGFDLRRRPGELPKLVAHRGASAVAPENTMAAFERAWLDRADIVEMDVRLSADHEVVVMHDGELGRTTDGTGLVSDWPVAELKRLDAGAWFGAAYAGEPIPTLREVLHWARGKVAVMLELKFDPFGSFDPQLVPAVASLIEEARMADQVVAISYQPRALVQLKILLPSVPAGPIYPADGVLRLTVGIARRFPKLAEAAGFRRVLTRPLRFTSDWGCDVVSPNVDAVTPALVAATHAAGYPLSCGGLRWNYTHAIGIGVDTVAANHPACVRRCYL